MRQKSLVPFLAYIFSIGFFALSVFFVPAKPVQACTWGGADCVYLKQSLEEIAHQWHGVLLGALKNAAVQVITQNVYLQIGGSRGGQPMFITDWRAALYTQPNQKAHLAVNDFFTLSTGGRGSFSNYRPQQQTTQLNSATARQNSLASDGILNQDIADVRYGNYNKFLKQTAQKSIDPGPCKVDIQEYGKIGTNFKSLDALTTSSDAYCNNVFAYSDAANAVYRNAYASESNIAQAQGIAYSGYSGLTQNGLIVTPGSNLKALVDNISDVPNKVMSAIENPYEFAAAAATTAINASVNILTQKGLAYVNTMTQRGVGYANAGINNSLGSGYVSIGTSGYNYNPAAPYVNKNHIPNAQVFNSNPTNSTTTNRQ